MVVNEQGEILTDTQPTKSGEQAVGKNGDAAFGFENNMESGDPMPMSKEHEEFLNYNKRMSKPVVVPTLGEADFCQKMKTFIETRGDGMASSDQLIEAYNLFQENCVEKKKENEQADGSAEAKLDTKSEVSDLRSPAPAPAEQHTEQPKSEEQMSPIMEEYLARDKKLSTFDDNLGMRPRSGESLEGKEFRIKKVNNEPILYFLLILGVAAMVYAASKRE